MKNYQGYSFRKKILQKYIEPINKDNLWKKTDCPYFEIMKFLVMLFLFLSAEPEASECRNHNTFCLHLMFCDEVCIDTVIFIDPCYFVLVTEVIDTDKLFFIILTYKGKNRGIPGINRAKRCSCIKDAVSTSDMFQMIQCMEKFSLYSICDISVRSKRPVKLSSVEITGISCLVRVIFVRVVIYLTDLVTAVDTEFPIEDSMASEKESFEKYSNLMLPMILGAIIGCVLWIISMVWLTAAAGRRPEDEKLHLNNFDKWYTEIAAGIVIAIWAVGTERTGRIF